MLTLEPLEAILECSILNSGQLLPACECVSLGATQVNRHDLPSFVLTASCSSYISPSSSIPDESSIKGGGRDRCSTLTGGFSDEVAHSLLPDTCVKTGAGRFPSIEVCSFERVCMLLGCWVDVVMRLAGLMVVR